MADELPDEFIAGIRRAMMEEKPDSFLLGEVWEDGSNKIAYDRRRKYLLGRETHGLMNYPFRVSALEYLRGGDAAAFREAMETIRENYPRSGRMTESLPSTMKLIYPGSLSFTAGRVWMPHQLS